jgi:oligosaccharyltransferase complex subunit beta
VAYNITVSEWDGSKWVPYVTDDIQVDIKLLDPYHRLTLKPIDTTEDSTVYGVEFKLPDHHGVFSFHTDYKRAGWTFIDEKVILSIRHLANDEYPRSWEITNSWVYITSIVAVLASWIIFLLAFIFAKDKTTETDKKTK